MSSGDENRRNPVRRLNFDKPTPPPASPDGDGTFEPPSWICEGVDVDAKVRQLREELIREGCTTLHMPIVDPRNAPRTEFRRIVAATDVMNEAIQLRRDETDRLTDSLEMSEYEMESLKQQQPFVERAVRRLQEELVGKGSSVSILEGTQTAVKAVLDICDDMATPGDDTNPTDMETNFGKISKLCGVAMDSYHTVQKKNEVMRKEVMAKRARQRRELEMARGLLAEPERRRVDDAERVLGGLSLEQLRELAASIRSI